MGTTMIKMVLQFLSNKNQIHAY